jgi:hypothetical protein
MDAVPQFFYDLEITRSSDHCFLSKVAIFQLEGVFCERLLLADSVEKVAPRFGLRQFSTESAGCCPWNSPAPRCAVA